MCQECVSYLFSYLRELKLSLTILGVKVGQNTFYFICNSSGQNFYMHFEESLSIEWVLRLMFWKKAVTWTTMNIAILITNNHTLACISVKCLQMDFVSSQSIEHSKRVLRKVVTLTTTWCPWTLNHHNSLTGCWERLLSWQPSRLSSWWQQLNN